MFTKKHWYASLLIAFLTLFLWGGTAHGQLTIQFRVVNVFSDADDMDPAGTGFNGGDSDPRWVYEIVDVPFGTAQGSEIQVTDSNCIGNFAHIDTFFVQTYPAGCNTPTDYTLNLSAADADVNPTAPLTLGGALANGSFNIPAVSLTYPTAGWQTLGTYTLTAGGTDCGSTGTVTWSFDIEYHTVGQTEFIPPTVNCLPGTITQNVDPGTCGAVVNGISPLAAVDNCGVSSQTWAFTGATVGNSPPTGINDASGNVFNAGTTTVTYTVEDYSTNSASCSFIVTIIDNELPAITCPNDTTVNATGGLCTAVVNGLSPVVTDNCAPALQTWSMSGVTTGTSPGSGVNDVSGETFNPGVTTVDYYVEDPGGNSIGCSFNVTVIDTTAPTITCPANITQNNSGAGCGATVTYATPVGTDNCPSPTTTMLAGLASGSYFPIGTTTVTYEVSDASGNTAQCSFDVTVVDNVLPTINCPLDITINNDFGSCGGIVTYFSPVGNDNCPGPSTSLIAGQASGTLFPVGTTTNTFEVVDASGNTAQCSFDVTVNDNQNPSITCPADITVSNDAGLCGATVNFTPPVGTDNCPGAGTSLITVLGPGDFYPIGSTVVTYEVIDATGNSNQCSFDVIVNDTELPVITCPADITTTNNAGLCDAVVTYTAPVGTDNCPGPSTSMIAGLASGSNFPVGTTVVTFEVTDASANTAQCSFNVTVNDTENPAITCPADITVGNDFASCDAVVNYVAPVGTDNCTGSVTSLIAGQTSGSVFPIGTTIVTYEVVDASSNTAQCSFDITVNDTENPAITCPADITVNNDAGLCGAVVTYAAPVGTDNCPGSATSILAGQASGTIFPIGTTTVTYQVTDASSNTAQCSFDITVNDTELPIISCPANITQSNDAGLCGATVNFVAPVGSDNCGGSTTALITVLGPGDFFPIGSTVVTYEVTDASGNTAQCSFDVIVNDDENPVITCPVDITVSNDVGSCGAIVTYTAPVGTDNCPGSATAMTAGQASGTMFPIGTTTVTYEVTDASGNTAQCSFDVTVNDTENPVLTCPADITVGNDPGVCDAIVNYAAPVGTDNCPGSVTSLISGLASGSNFPIGTTTVTYEVVDASSNSVQCSFDVTVNDTELPLITCPVDVTTSNDPGLCGAIVNYVVPVGTDNCPGAATTILAGQASGTVFPVGTTTVTYQVTDASSNTAQCSFDITINDTQVPTITCPSNITQNNDAGLCGATVNFVAPVGNDNCPGSTTALITALGPGDFFPIGTTPVTYEVTDASGNTAQCSFDVTVNDTENPTITCPADINAPNDINQCTAVVTFTAPVGTDNCPGSSTAMIAGFPSGAAFPVGTTVQTFEVTDASGNTATCSFNINVSDTQLPSITCTADITVPNDPSDCGAIVNYPAPVVSDNCPGFSSSMIGGLATGSFFPIGTTTVTFEVIDAASNSTTCSFDVTVNDTESPAIACPANINVNNDPGLCGATVTYTTPVGTDNCPGQVTNIIAGQVSGTVFPVGITTVTYEVVDASSNATQCSFTVTVNDTENPTITCPADVTISNDPGLCAGTVAYTTPVGVDNCAGSTTSMIAGQASGALFNTGTTVVTYEVVDASGNTAQCSFNVTVNDTENPTITCPSNVNTNSSAGTCGAIVIYTPPVGTDNCPGPSTSMIAGQGPGTSFPVGTTTVTYEVIDASGNTAQCSFDVTVVDNENPTITCPGNVTVNNDVGSCDAVVLYGVPVGNDNCPGATTSMTSGLASGSAFPVGTTTVTYEVVDASGNTAQCSFDVTVNDTELPTITCPADITTNNGSGLCGAIVNYTTSVGADNCPGATTSLLAGQASGTLFPIGTTTNTYEVIDASGNSAQCSFDVTVNDTQLPAITCPSNVFQGNDLGSCDAVVNYSTPVGSDNCPGSVTSLITGLASGSNFPVGTTTITYEVIDASGNSSQCSFDVTIFDSEAPGITCPANITVANDIGSCGAIVNYTAPIGTDNCPGASTSMIAGLTSGSLFPIGTTTVTYEVVDGTSNANQCSFDVTVNDTELPAITCPANITVGNDAGLCEAVVTYATPVGTDNCPGATTTLVSGLSSGSAFPIGTTNVTYEVIDATGNTTQCTFDVTVNDTEMPVIACPADINVNNNPGQCGAVVTYTAPVGTDNCPGATTSMLAGQASGTVFPVGTTFVTYEVVDAAGNATQCSFNITVTDTENPTITCPSNLSVNNDPGACNALVTYGAPVGTDNCPGVTTVLTAGLATGSTFPVGTTAVTYEATDASGNVASCSFNVIVNDTEAPVVTCPANISVSNDPGICGAIVTFTPATSTDNCGMMSTTQVSGQTSGSLFAAGTTIVTFEGLDINGNTGQCSFDVTVIDAEAPTITCPADITQNNDPGDCAAIVNYSAPVISDNCPGSSSVLISGLLSGASYPLGTTTNTYEVVDFAGNTAQCSFDVTVIDGENPTITCPANVTASNDPGTCDAVVTYGAPVFSDNCAGSSVLLVGGLASGSTFPVGTTTNTYEVTDAAGNTAQCTFDIVVNDDENPFISCPSNISVNNDPGLCEATVTYTAPVGIDNCPGASTSMIAGQASGTAFTGGVTTVTYEVIDVAGNTAQCSFDVTVNDTEIPVVTCPADLTVNNDPGVCGAIVNYGNPVVADNCPFGTGTVTVISGFATGTQFPVGTTNVILEFADVSGNSAQCSFNVTVDDVEPPVPVCPPDQFVTANAQCEFVLQDYTGIFSATDNCGTFTIQQSPAAGTVVSGGTVVNMFATDQYGNVDFCQFNVNANDVTAPILTCPTSDTVYMSLLCDYTVDSLLNFITVVENCNNYTFTQTPALGNIIYDDTLASITVTDGAGNSSSCSFNLVVQDSTPPIVTCPVDYEVYFSSICDFIIQDYSLAISTWDNCGFASLTQNPAPGMAITGPTSVIMTGTDINGNVNTCSFDVIPLDTVPPTLQCPGDQLENLNDSCTFILPDYTPLGNVISTCEIIPLSQTPPPGTPITANTTIALSGYDYSGNFNACTFNVILQDTIPPVIFCPPDINSCDSVVNYTPPTATDNCNVASLARIAGPPSGSVFPSGITVITYEATDDFGNIDTCSFLVTVLPLPEIIAQVSDISCYGLADGSIDVTVNSGSTPFTYQWSNGLTSEDANGLIEGNYQLIVTDKFGCTDTLNDSIVMPPLLTTDYNISPTGCYGDIDGFISLVNVTGGTNPYNFVWDPPVGAGTSASNLTPGTYSVSIVDVNGCSADTTIIIENSDTILVTGEVSMYDNGFNISEENGFDGWIDLTVTGGSTPYTYYWDSGHGTQDIFGLPEGTYNISIVDDNGCEGYGSFVLIAPINIDVSNGMSPNGDGVNDVFFIENIEQFPNSHLIIMNRWGDIVYEVTGYQNDWDGTPNNGLVMYGNKVPEGSYFYTLDPGQEPYEKMSGYLIINGY